MAWFLVRPMKLDKQFLVQNSEKNDADRRSLFIILNS